MQSVSRCHQIISNKPNKFTRRKAQLQKTKPPPQPADSRPVEVVCFIPHTTKSQLKDIIQKEDDKTTKFLNAGRTKYVERSGTSMGQALVKKDPWYLLNGGCQRPTCYHCIHSGQGKVIKCRQESVVYTISCKVCAK